MDFFNPYGKIDRVYNEMYDNAIIGYCQNTMKPIYSVSKLTRIMKKEEGLDHYDALDFISNHMRHDDAIIAIDYE